MSEVTPREVAAMIGAVAAIARGLRSPDIEHLAANARADSDRLEKIVNRLVPLVDQLAASAPPPVCTGSGWPPTALYGAGTSPMQPCGVCGESVPVGADGKCATHPYRPKETA